MSDSGHSWNDTTFHLSFWRPKGVQNRSKMNVSDPRQTGITLISEIQSLNFTLKKVE
jgi:hypothetical protein